MIDVIRFAIIGAAAGSIYGLLALGVNVVYRASRVANFSHAAIAVGAAYVYTEFQLSVPPVAAALIAIVIAGAFGLLCEFAVMRPLKNASNLTKAIATIGLLLVVQSLLNLRYGYLPRIVTPWLPGQSVQLGPVALGADRIVIFCIGMGLTVALTLVYTYTSLGRATNAAADNPQALAALGRWSPQRVAAINWAVGGTLAGLGGVLLAPISSLSPTLCVTLIVPVLSAALIGRFHSFPVTFVGAVLVGVGQAEIGRVSTVPGLQDALPFLIIVVVLVTRGRSLPARGEAVARLPALTTGRIPSTILIVVAATSLVLTQWVLPERWVGAVTAGLITAIILMSLVVVTGFAGQLSLASYALAGVAALVSAQLVGTLGWSFVPAALVGVIATMPVALLVGLPSVRTRGTDLAIVTLGLAVTFQTVILDNRHISNGTAGLDVTNPEIFGIAISAINEPRRYGLVVLVVAFAVGLAVLNIRRSPAGRRMVAVRANERASAALGISVPGTKLIAFVMSGAIAGAGGVLLAFTNFYVVLSNPGGRFDPFYSLNAVAQSTIGGVGFVGGSLVGSMSDPASVLGVALAQALPGAWFGLIGGVLLIVTVIGSPSGVVPSVLSMLGRIPFLRTPPPAVQIPPRGEPVQLEGSTLEVTGLTVRFGSVDVLSDVALTLSPGTVLGIIGPNGAGKTTLVDAITGFAPIRQGSVQLDGNDITRLTIPQRARRGVARSFQSLELFEDLTAADNLIVAGEQPAWWSYVLAAIKPGVPQLGVTAQEAIRVFKLESRLNDKPADLNYGDRRLLAIARALAGSPRVLLLDEPAAGLASEERAELRTLIREIADVWQIAVLLIEHDVELVMAVSDRVLALDFGRVIAEGPPDDVRRDSAVIASYLGASDDAIDAAAIHGAAGEEQRS